MSEMLEGKVAVVTGAGHGIGRGHALELARQGARVVVNDLGTSVTGEGSSRDADLTVELIAARGGTAVADYGNVVDEADAEAMIERALDEWGRFDILVNNAGIVRDGVIWNLTTEAWDAVMAVHVRGPWLTSRAAARHWRSLGKAGLDSRGRIINTTSGAGLVGNFGQTNYATAKAAVVGLTLTLALELQRTRGHGECHRAGRSDTHHRHHAQCPCGRGTGRDTRGLLPSPRSRGELAGGRLVGLGRGAVRDGAGHPGDRRQDPPDARLGGGRLGLQRRKALGCIPDRRRHGDADLRDAGPRPADLVQLEDPSDPADHPDGATSAVAGGRGLRLLK